VVVVVQIVVQDQMANIIITWLEATISNNSSNNKSIIITTTT
jgi:hypothetical protein